MRSLGPPETATAAAALAEQGRGGPHSHSSAIGAPRRVAMLPGLALALLAAWTVQALEVGAALRNGGRGHSEERILLKSLIQRSRVGGNRRKPFPFRSQRPTFGRSAHPCLRPNPVLGTGRGRGRDLGLPGPRHSGANRGGDPELRSLLSPCLLARG